MTRTPTSALVADIQAILSDLHDDASTDLGPEWAPGGKWYRNPVADVQLHVGDDAVKHGGQDVAVLLTYDGAGYDYLSPSADYPSVSEKWQAKLWAAAKRHGFEAEEYNSWSVGFYPA
jgi:hypothetical protein|tara:strand:+ start:399 stop:752 length:354 start_codon:yes stop_codon:yes gene_type:complete